MKKELPFVSVCTPTYNRRPFIKNLISSFLNQDYPQEKMEWIIVDDGTDKIDDIIEEANIKQIKYFPIDNKMILGKKRNFMNSKAKGKIIVYFDDDDYYPKERISHAVEMLDKNPNKLIAGCRKTNVYFKHIDKIVEFDTGIDNHTTAGTWAFKREILKETSFEEKATFAEEKFFLKNNTFGMVLLEPKKTILVISHSKNTFDKKKLLTKKQNWWKFTDYTLDDFISDEKIKNFIFNDLETTLELYGPNPVELVEERKFQIILGNTSFYMNAEEAFKLAQELLTRIRVDNNGVISIYD